MALSNSGHARLFLKAAACGSCATLLLAPSALAQGAGGATLRGSVTDASGGVLPGATVAVVNQRTTLTRTATTDSRGEYVLPALVSGPYRARVDLPGFARWQSGDFHLSPGDSRHIATTLEVAGRIEAVSVEAARAMARTDSGARESVIGADEIQNLTIISRGALELLHVLPGTVSDQNMEAVSFASGSNNLFFYSINGQRGTQLNPVLDGSKILDFGSNGAVMVNINPDMVEEVKVQSSNYAAEYGSGTVQITAVTKSGSSQLHGSVYDYWRNWRLAANDRSNNYAGVPRPESNYNYPGLNLGGPLLLPGTDYNKNKDKLFFFVGFEMQRQTLDQGTLLGVVPTLAQREGDFSELLAGRGQNLGQQAVVTIPDGFPGAGEPAPGNDLLPYVDPYGQTFLGLYPLPNHTDPHNRYNYALTELQPLNRRQLVSRIDWNASASTHAYVRLALEREQTEWARGTFNCCSSFALPSAVAADNRSMSVSTTLTSVVSPSLTNEIVVSFSRLKLDNDWKDPARVSLTALGIPGYRGAFDTGSDEVPLQFHSWTGLGDLNAGGGLPLSIHNDSLSLAGSLTKVLATHTLKLGVFVERGQRQQSFWSALQGAYGLYGIGTPGGTGNDYGDLLVGRMAEFYQETEAPRGDWRFWNFEAYVQDAWKPRRNLTLELGLRLAKLPNNQELKGLGLRLEPSAYDDSQGAFIDGDPERPNGVLVASRGEIPKGMTSDPGLKAMPRINFAWDVQGGGEWVLRGGAGFFYNRPQGSFQYHSQLVAPNRHNTRVGWWDAPDGGLTIGNLPNVDPYTRPGAVWVESLDSRSIHLPRTITWSLAVDKRLPGQQALEVAYVGNRQDFLPNRTPSSYIVPGSLTGTVGNADLDNPLHRAALDPAVAASFRVFPAYGLDSWWYQYEAVATYHGVQATLSRSAGRRLQYFLNYTFSKVLGTMGVQDNAVIDPIDPRNRSYGVPIWDRTHIFNASYNVIVPDPIGPDGNGLLRGLLNGWQVSGLTRYSSGLPFHVNFTGDIESADVQRAWWGTDAHSGGTWNGGNASGVTPILLGNPQLRNTGVGEKVLDIGKIAIPAFGESGPFQSPYYLRTPSRWNFDVSVIKNVALGGSKRLQFRVGFFNLFNQALPVYWMGDVDFNLKTVCNVRVDGVPDGAGGTRDFVCDPTQGFHFSDDTVQNFGKIKTKRGHRVIELAARFDF